MAKKNCSAGQTWDTLIKKCIPSETEAMAKKACSAGQRWDNLIKKCIPSETEAMAKKACSAGQRWDNLIKKCIPSNMDTRHEPDRPTEPPLKADVNHVRVMASAPQADPLMVLSPALWIFVVLATVGSILALALWLIIYRREARHSSSSGDVGPGLQPLHKTEPLATIHPLPSERNSQAQMFQRAAEALSSCPHLHLGDQTGSKWEDGFISCRGPAKHAGKDGGGGLPACSTMREHKIPLPATELGGTACSQSLQPLDEQSHPKKPNSADSDSRYWGCR
ncbi:uncharacterized protein [Trachinotus anak]|uniref:uncharacterized protein n=1 Tax=Trachinotus anak TaxID=443729 RepID=UPI0039F21218